MSIARKLTSEPTIYVATGLFLLLMILTSSDNFSIKLASVYGTMIGLDFAISQFITPRVNINPIANNSLQSISYAIGAILLLMVFYSILNAVARQSALVGTPEGSALSRNFAIIKQQATIFSIEFEKIPVLSFLLFGIVIPVIETRLVSRIFDFITQTFSIAYNRFNATLISVIIFIAGLFTYFHFKVRGLNNNIDLLLTFIFGVMTVLLIIKFKEAESATEFHIGWNAASILKGG